MLKKVRLLLLLFLCSSCGNNAMEYPNSNFLRYTPKSSLADIDNPAMLINNKTVRIPDLQPKDFKDKNVQNYFKNKYPNAAMPPNARSYSNQVRPSNMRNYTAKKPNMPAMPNSQQVTNSPNLSKAIRGLKNIMEEGGILISQGSLSINSLKRLRN